MPINNLFLPEKTPRDWKQISKALPVYDGVKKNYAIGFYCFFFGLAPIFIALFQVVNGTDLEDTPYVALALLWMSFICLAFYFFMQAIKTMNIRKSTLIYGSFIKGKVIEPKAKTGKDKLLVQYLLDGVEKEQEVNMANHNDDLLFPLDSEIIGLYDRATGWVYFPLELGVRIVQK